MKKPRKTSKKKGAAGSLASKPGSRVPAAKKKSKGPAKHASAPHDWRSRDTDMIIRDRTPKGTGAKAEFQAILEEQALLAKDLALFRRLMDLSNDALFVVDPQSGHFLDVNENACRSLGYTRDELLRLRVSDISKSIPDPAAWNHLVAEMIKKPSGLRESEHRRKDGSVFPVEISIHYVSMEDGSYVIGLARDITERKRREAIAHRNEERLRSIAEAVTAVIYRLNPEGYVTYVSPSITMVLGFTTEEAAGKHFTDFIHPEDLQKAVRAYELLLQGTSFMNLDLRVLRKSDSAIFAELNIIPIMSGNRMTEIQGIIHDISERKRRDQELRNAYEEAKMFRLLVESSDQAVGTANLDTTVTYGNAALLRMLDMPTLESFQSHSFQDFYEKEDLDYLMENAVPVALSGNSWTGEIPLRSWLGRKIPTIHNLHVIRNSDGSPAAFANIITDITERKRSEMILRESEERFRAVFESARDGIMVADLESLQIVAANPAILEMLGYSAGEILGLAVSDIHPGADEQRTREEFALAMTRLKMMTSDVPVKKKDGSVFFADISAALIMLAGRQCIVGIFHDVTSRKKSEQAIRESEARLRSIADAVSDVIYRIGVDGILTYVSPSVKRVLGYAGDELVGKNFADYIHQDDLQATVDSYHRLLAGEPLRELNARICTSTGGFIDAEVNAVPISRDGVVVEVQGIFRDITERKRVEGALRAKTEELDRYFTNALDLLCIADMDGYFRRMNKEWEAALGYSITDLEGTRFLDYVHSEDLDATLGALARLGAQEEVLNFTNRYRAKDGSYRWIEWRSFPAGNLIYASARDITERKRAEEALRESRNLLRAILDTIPVRVFWKDRDLKYLGCNQPFALDAGVGSPEDIVGKNDHQMGWQEQADLYRSDDRQVLESGKPKLNYEEPQTTPDGRRIWLRTNKVPLQGIDGTIYGVLGTYEDITERKKAETALRESEARLSATLKSLPFDFWICDKNGRYLMQNINSEILWGNVVGKRPEELGAKSEILAKWLDNNRRAFAGETVNEEVRYQFLGEEKIFHNIIAPVLEDDKISGILGINIDITESRKAAETIQRSYKAQVVISELLRISLTKLSLSEILQQAINLILSLEWLSFESKGCIFLADAGGDLIMTAQKNMDTQSQERCARIPSGTCMCGRAASVKEVVFADRIDEHHSIVYKGEPPHGHYCIPIVSKTILLGVVNVYVREGHQKNDIEVHFLNAVANALAGIIQRKKAEDDREELIQRLQQSFDAVARSKQEWVTTFDSISDPIYIADDEYKIIKANRAFAEYLDLDLKDILNMKCCVLLHGTSTPPANCPHSVCLRERRLVSGEFNDPRTHQVFYLSAFPYRSAQKDAVGSIMVMKDITEEREREMKMIMSERLAALGQMAAGIAHEINNPLAAILGCAEGLLNRMKQERFDPVLFTNYLNIIEEEVVRCKTITTEMLSFVRKSTYEAKDIDIESAIEKTLEIIGFQGRLKEVAVIRHFAQGMPVVHASEGELRQVFLALMTNALDAMNDRGTLSIEIAPGDRTACVKISDTGAGIAAEYLGRIFDPFFTTKADQGGTGLGLSISNKIISSHGGSIDVFSVQGKGTTFTIRLPLVPPT
jgi:PAS domain S-box-containing protein